MATYRLQRKMFHIGPDGNGISTADYMKQMKDKGFSPAANGKTLQENANLFNTSQQQAYQIKDAADTAAKQARKDAGHLMQDKFKQVADNSYQKGIAAGVKNQKAVEAGNTGVKAAWGKLGKGGKAGIIGAGIGLAGLGFMAANKSNNN